MDPLVFQSDFGHVDGAVSAMYGVAFGVDPTLIRLGVVLLSLMGFSGVFAYIIAAIIIPRSPY